MRIILSKFYKNLIFLPIVVFIFSILRFPSLAEPYWYGDEGIYEVMGKAINQGRILYEGIWDNKPPLLYIIYAAFDGDLFYVRLASLLVGVATVIVFFHFARKLFKREVSVYISTLVFALLFALPIIEGNIANAENFMLLPILTAFYFSVTKPLPNTKINYIISGLLLSCAFLIKTVAIFDLAAITLTILVLNNFENVFNFCNTFKKIEDVLFLLVSFSIPVLATVFYFYINGAMEPFLITVFSQNVGYVEYGNNFLFPMDLLLFKMLLLLVGVVSILLFRRHIGSESIVIFIWFAFALFSAFFSQRPYNHYLLLLLPAFALMVGLALERRKMLIITSSLIIPILLFINYTFSPNLEKSFAYYQNYISFMANNKSTHEYWSFFDSRTPADYAIVDFINAKTSEEDNVFLWSNSAQIYTLSNKMPPGRYIVAYHITLYPNAIEETKAAIDDKKPKYIIQTSETPEIKHFLDNYEIRYKMDGVNIYERKS